MPPDQVELGRNIAIVCAFLFVLFFTVGILNIKVTRKMIDRQDYKFIRTVAIINCFTGVLGMFLGIFSLMALQKSNIIREFELGESKDQLQGLDSKVIDRKTFDKMTDM